MSSTEGRKRLEPHSRPQTTNRRRLCGIPSRESAGHACQAHLLPSIPLPGTMAIVCVAFSARRLKGATSTRRDYGEDRTSQMSASADPNALADVDSVSSVSRHLRRYGSTGVSVSATLNAWLRLPSQSSGVTYNYLLILAGFQSVKPDRMVIRFVEEHAGLSTAITPLQTAELIKKVAEALSD